MKAIDIAVLLAFGAAAFVLVKKGQESSSGGSKGSSKHGIQHHVNPDNKAHYTAVFVEDPDLLIQHWAELGGRKLLPELRKPFAMRLETRPDFNTVRRTPHGSEVGLQVRGIIDTPELQGFLVKPMTFRKGEPTLVDPSSVLSKDGPQFIAIATAPGAQFEAVSHNAQAARPITGGRTFRGFVGFELKDGIRTSLEDTIYRGAIPGVGPARMKSSGLKTIKLKS